MRNIYAVSIILFVTGYLFLLYPDRMTVATLWCKPSLSDTLCAGILQARASLFAGATALYAGYLVYRSATKERDERDKKAAQKKLAYKYKWQAMLRAFEFEFAQKHRFLTEGYYEHQFSSIPQAEPVDFPNLDDWENYGMFGKKTIEHLYKLHHAVKIYNDFIIKNHGLDFDSLIEVYAPETYIKNYEFRKSDLEAKLKKLQKFLRFE